MPDPVLVVESLRKEFGTFVAVEDASFKIDAGGSLGVVGESGSGKTTIARIVVGLESATAGTVVCCGKDRTKPARRSRDRRRRGSEVQIVFQDPYSSLDRRQSVEDALAEVVRLHDDRDAAARSARVREVAATVSLGERQLRSLPRSLSGGERQRVAIARALCARPRLIILDEAVSALDVSIQAQVLNLLSDIRSATGVAYMLISHDLAVVRQLCEDAVVLERGRIVEAGPTATILASPQHPYTRELIASVPGPGWRPRRRTATHGPDADPAAD